MRIKFGHPGILEDRIAQKLGSEKFCAATKFDAP